MTTRTLCVALWMSVASAACDSNSGSPSGGSHDGGPSDGGPSDGGHSDAATSDQLKILSLSTTVSTVTGGQPVSTETNSVTFVAIVTDTKGLDTIAGGQLVDGSGATYAAFEAGTNKGTYTATLTYQQMNQINALDFLNTGGIITLTAKFFDNDANVATTSVALHLACRNTTYGLMGACGGSCTDRTIDYANCGTCGNACIHGLYCAAGTCKPAVIGVNNNTSCISARSIDLESSCSEICTAAGGSCATGAQLWDDASCATTTQGHSCGTALKYAPSFKGLVCGC